ncbi:MAG: DUF2231 domain-containing protein [Calditrichaeota bacterium]|nr:DUF2231 domain-containing protein [Calditrichota bacterium]
MFDITLLHPKVVHFPIALVLVAFVFDILGMIKKNEFYYRFAWINLVLAFFAAVVAIVSGLLAANNVPHNDLAHETMETHENLGYVIGGILAVLVFWRFRLKGAFPEKGKWIYLLLFFVGVGTVVISSDLGGKMVYEFGVAVKAVPQVESEGHSHDGDGHSHGESASPSMESHEHGEGEDHHQAGAESKMKGEASPEKKQKKLHKHDDGSVHEH